MAWATVQSGQNTSATTSVAVTLSGTPTNGNLLIAAVMSNVAKTVVTMSAGGATWIPVDAGINYVGTSDSLLLFYKIAASESATNTANATAATVMQLHVFEFSGNYASPLDSFTPIVDDGASHTSLLLTSPGLNQNTELAFAVIAQSNTNGNTIAWTNSYAGGLSNDRLITSLLALGSSSPTSTTGSWVTSRRCCGYIATFFSPITVSGHPRSLLGVGA